jgi:hypothetical protein
MCAARGDVDRGDGVDRLLVVRSALAGVGAYACAYVITYATVLVAVSGRFVDASPTWKVAGWYLHAAHFGLLKERPVGEAAPENAAYDLLQVTDGGMALLLVVPPLSAAVAGFGLAWWLRAGRPGRGALLGGLLALGYPVGTVIVAAGTAHVAGDPIVAVEFRPRLSSLFVVASVAYPLLFGVFGGAIGGYLRGEYPGDR